MALPTELAAESSVAQPEVARPSASTMPSPACAQGAPKNLASGNLAVIQDAETETLLRTNANPLFRAAAPDVNLVRIIHVSDAAIDSFVSTGNRMLIACRPRTAAGTERQ